MRKTAKVFSDYNDYHDHGIMKWATAFAMAELVSGIEKNHQSAVKTPPILPEMTAAEIDQVLLQAFTKNLPVIVQTYERDEFDRPKEPFTGCFSGLSAPQQIMIANRTLMLTDIRHVSLIDK